MHEAAAGAIADETLSAAARDVLETMFFTSILGETAGGMVRSAAGRFESRLRFRDERPGEFRLQVSRDAARSIAANFLGLEDESAVTEREVGDVVCELANMICGAVLSRLGGELAFDLSHPELWTDGANSWPDTDGYTFDLGNGAVTVAIRFEHP